MATKKTSAHMEDSPEVADSISRSGDSGPKGSVGGKTTSVFSHCGGTEIVRDAQGMKPVQFHIVLKELISKQKLTVRVLSKGTKIPASTLTSYLAGKKHSYAAEHILALAEFFNVTTDYLLTGKTPNAGDLSQLPMESFFDGIVRLRIDRVKPEEKK